MRMRVVGAEAAVRGFALAGVGGEIVTTTEELHAALNAALNDESVGIVLLTEDAASLDREWIDEAKVRSTVPLIVEVPGPGGPDSERPALGEVVRRITGVRI
ncbi:MAG: V-type ATP synthase subunit F [Anaerolineae bacterium]